MKQGPTNHDILQAINSFAQNVEDRFQQMEQRMNSFVTKDYLDDKLFDLKGDLIGIIRKEDTKLSKLVNILRKRKSITHNDAKEVLAMQPFIKK